MQRHQATTDSPHPRQHMVSGSQCYTDRADIERGLKKRDFPSIEQSEPSEKERQAAADKGQTTVKQ